ncbi:rhodanese-like domain-containing protein [Candidatus Woesearchaeota archaeon]|jgi:rhodanese-related sulfurtransferase|nr:rhodanese-like domain-containing protein [Candidatus Woesearchaeota archaeon]
MTEIIDVDANEGFEFIKNNPDIIILDIRTPMEFESERIKGAINIDMYSNNFKNDLDKLDKNKPVFLYCRTDSRSNYSKNIFVDLGFKKVYHLEEGILDWMASGLSVES